MNSPHKGQVMQEGLTYHDVIPFQAGHWTHVRGVNITRNHTKVEEQVADSLKNTTLNVTTIMVCNQKHWDLQVFVFLYVQVSTLEIKNFHDANCVVSIGAASGYAAFCNNRIGIMMTCSELYPFFNNSLFLSSLLSS